MLAQKEFFDDIRLGLSVLQTYVRPGGPLNLNEINVHAEDFVGGLLNACDGYRLENFNRKRANAPCIDLIDTTNRLGVQVSSENGSQKINDTLDCINRNKLPQDIDKLIVFMLVKKQGSYTIKTACPGVAFDWKKDVIDFDDMLQKVRELNDLNKLKAIHHHVETAMPRLFASRRSVLAELASRIEECLRIFDREVMSAPFRFEDPVRMCHAIIEMRVALQTQGASRIPSDTVAAAFKGAHSILRECEYDVKDIYTEVHKAAQHVKPGEPIPAVDYSGSEYGDAINLMMAIRPRLEPLLRSIEAEHQEIMRKLGQ